MSSVVRHVRDYQEVVYTVGPDSVYRAICAFLYDDHGGSFTPETTITFRKDGSAIVSTTFASVDRNPEGQDPAEGLGAEHESAVGATGDETPNPSSQSHTERKRA